MPTYGSECFFGICLKAADEISSFHRPGLTDDFSLAFHHHDTLQSSPRLFLHQPLNIFCCPTASLLNTPVIFLQALCKAVRDALEVDLLSPLEIVGHVLVQRALIAFQTEHVIGFLADDLCVNLTLAAHRIDSYDAACDLQYLQKSRNCGDFIRFLLGSDLP